eukprot:CAMPEP_0201566782 /NCGR_PEP_ID=MMETSP0190_2-20130828/6860_1 /ASSEMBLY_ACC=CAM_ASM_000263 /TAXON_ID=37353 /ORGANISM="Rosalina sp." /LENGTH=1780 /DNA_ID=CAMNT_0047985985 /DNA_START=1581 /DNA_END=6920 /DNA_ORIENTATION=-
MQTQSNNNESNNAPLLISNGDRYNGNNYGSHAQKSQSSHNLIETEDVSFCSMITWLLWKNYKSQFQRRKVSWIIKMMLPVVFTLILGALRTAFTVDNEPVDYGNGAGTDFTIPFSQFDSNLSDHKFDVNINQPFAINNFTTESEFFITLPLCAMNFYAPASFMSVSPRPGADPHIDAVMEIMRQKWTTITDINNLTVDELPCLVYASSLPFEEGWLLKYFDSPNDIDNYCKDTDYGKGFGVSGDINDDKQKNRPIGFGISWDIPSSDGLQWSYRLRFNASGDSIATQQGGQGPPSPFEGTIFPVPSTDQPNINVFNRALTSQWLAGPGNYYYSFFLHFQTFVDNAITEYISTLPNSKAQNDTMEQVRGMTKGFYVHPTPAYETDDFWTTISGLFVFFILISFVYPYSQIVKALVEEKAGKIKEGLKMMGATFSSFWVSWYIWFFFEFVLMACAFAFIGKGLDVFQYSDTWVIFTWMLLFCINCVTYATLVSTIFDNPKVASLIGVFMFIIALYGGFFSVILDDTQKVVLCLLGPSCFSTSLTNLGQYEQSLIGLQWDNIDDTYAGFKFSTTLYMLAFDSVLYILLTLYMDKVFPSRYGQRESPFFLCLPSFWCPKKHSMKSLEVMGDAAQLNRQLSMDEQDGFEQLGNKYENQEPAISIRKLTKHFTSMMSSKIVKAVNGISMDIFSGEVFCLLGHNGAGKTTTISMLTGLLNITSGNAWILGDSVQAGGMKNIRKSLGVCPQHDVLFKRLTVREHLELFCRLKGVPSRLIPGEVDKTIDQIGVKDKEHEFPPNLSGGQKRKLSLGIALIGGSKIVFLDEPTSGMDPQSRRVTWDLIAKEKKNRCIILTTHFMDEADILADRIAIMSTGYLRCCGSSLFLKRLYGVGYTFTISLNIGADPTESKNQIDTVVLESIEGSSVISVAGGEIAYRLPFEQTASFPDVFEQLDTVKEDLSISTYGISITTLEEVFLKIGEEHKAEIEGVDDDETDSDLVDPFDNDAESIKLHQSGAANADNSVLKGAVTVGMNIDEDDDDEDQRPKKPVRLESDYQMFEQPTFQLKEQSELLIFLEHFFAILYRRWFWGIRDFRALCCQVLLPGYFAAVGLAILKLTTSVNNPNLVLSTNQWYGSDAGLQGYEIPYSNISGYNGDEQTSNFGVNSSFVETFDKLFAPSVGNLSYVPLSNNSLFNVTDYQTYLLNNLQSDDGKWHYNSFWTSHGYLSPVNISINNQTLPPINQTLPPNVTLPPIFNTSIEEIRLNNTIQLGVNCTAVHALPIVYNLANNWVLNELVHEEASISVSSHPLVITSDEKAISDSFGGIFASLFLMIAFAFIPVGAVYNIVIDRTKLTKHQQLVSGISFVSYWVGNFVADLIAAIPAMLIVYILIHAFDVDVYLGDAQGPFLAVLILFTMAILPFTYILSYLFTAADKAQTVVGTIYLVLGMILLIVSFVLDGINDQTKEINDAFENVYRIFPTFLMADGLFQIALKPLLYPDDSYFKWDIIGRDCTLMAIECVGYFLVVLLVEYCLNQPWVLTKLGFITNVVDDVKEELDSDVEKEINRIQSYMPHNQVSCASSINNSENNGYNEELVSNGANNGIADNCSDTVVLAGLRKVYKGSNGRPPNVAVRDVYLGVPQGQVFGYLGVNGAGKTTTLACLTGERFKSAGQAYIHGISIENQIQCRRYIGYCPQFDALFDLLTGKEHLRFYGMLKGLRGQKLKDQVNLLLRVLSLTKYKNRKAGTYSGGNKRKLSVAISMIGNPPVVFLDEPSTGMDPMARRHMW